MEVLSSPSLCTESNNKRRPEGEGGAIAHYEYAKSKNKKKVCLSPIKYTQLEGTSVNDPLALLLPYPINAPLAIPRLLPSRVIGVHHFVRNLQISKAKNPRPATARNGKESGARQGHQAEEKGKAEDKEGGRGEWGRAKLSQDLFGEDLFHDRWD